MEKYLKKIKPKHYPLLAFLLTAVTYTMAFSYKQMLGNGLYTILRSDLLHQYVPFIEYFCKVLKGEHSYWYSWSNGMGGGTSLLYAYYTLSPFNLIYLLLGDDRELTATALVVILKASLSAAFFQLYITRFLRKRHIGTVLFAMMYALCGFQICYYFCIIWMDAMFILPLLCIGFLRLMHEKKVGLLLFGYTYIFAVNFYMGYIVGMCSLFLFVFYSVYKANKISGRELVRIWLRFAATVFVSALLTAAIWLPAGIALLTNREPRYPDFIMHKTNLLFLINNLFLGEMQTMFGYVAFIYTGLFTALLIPFFFLNRSIPRRIRICAGLCLGWFFLFCLLRPFNRFIHAFDSPEMLNYRFSYAISFLLATIASYELFYIKRLSDKGIFLVIFVYLCIYIGTFFAYPLVYENADKVNSNNLVMGIVNAAFFMFYAGWIVLHKRKKLIGIGGYLLLALVMAVEVGVNFSVCTDRFAITMVQQDDYYEIKELERDVLSDLDISDAFCRVLLINPRGHNKSMEYDFNGVTMFSSAENKELMNALEKFGFMRGIHSVKGLGSTPVTRSVFDIRYVVNANAMVYDLDYESVDEIMSHRHLLYVENETVLPLGFVVSDHIKEFVYDPSPFVNQNRLLSLMMGEQIDCFEKTGMQLDVQSGQYIQYENGLTVLSHEEDANTEKGVFRFYKEKEERPLYAYLSQDRFYTVTEGEDLTKIETEDATEEKISMAYNLELVPATIFRVGENTDGQYEFSIILDEEAEADYFDKAYFALYDDMELQKAYRILNQQPLRIDEWEDCSLSGSVSANFDGMLFTSVPYEAGWSAWVDGTETQICPLLEDAFVGIPVSQGTHTIRLRYTAPGRWLGLWMSVCGLLLIPVLLKLCAFRQHKEYYG